MYDFVFVFWKVVFKCICFFYDFILGVFCKGIYYVLYLEGFYEFVLMFYDIDYDVWVDIGVVVFCIFNF